MMNRGIELTDALEQFILDIVHKEMTNRIIETAKDEQENKNDFTDSQREMLQTIIEGVVNDRVDEIIDELYITR